jgi:RNA polymerase sigma-70 factor (ECF subfamily)
MRELTNFRPFGEAQATYAMKKVPALPENGSKPAGRAESVPAEADTDRRLMELVATQDAAAERELVERLMARVRRATGALLRNPADADDAAQLCMLEVLRSAKGFRGEGSLEAWADRIVIRTAIRHAKKQARTRQMIDGSRDPDSIQADNAGERRRVEEVSSHVAEYLEQLPEARRHALVLRHVLGYSVDEIAALTGVSRNTVKDRLLAARREFRKMLRREETIASSSRRTA